MSDAGTPDEILSRRIRDRLLAFLRYAVTREEADRDAFLARAREMDRGGYLEPPAFAFFTRTSSELCDAVLNKDDPQSRAMLERLIKRVGDSRLRHTLEKAIGLEPFAAKGETPSHNRDYLWRGLVASK